MGEDRRSHSSIPLVSRLDRLDFMMKYIEGKQDLSRWSSHKVVGRECKPWDTAMREAHSKGSLLDRVASLEDRLHQLCLEVESSGVSNSKVQKSCSLPTFRTHYAGYKQPFLQTNVFKFQGKPQRLEQRPEQPRSVKQQHGNKDDKNCKSGKKGAPLSWPHLRLLGC